jgi:hypothetical protein
MSDFALMVDINRYPTCPLDGCDNDIHDATQFIISKRNFDRNGIQILQDGRATTKAILARCEWLVSKARAGDRVLFWYSGHGAQVPSKTGEDEVDGLNEVICPVDFDWEPEHMITDKQFHATFMRFAAGVHFNWVSDSCHSGDLTREIPLFDVNGRHHVTKPRAFPMPRDIAWHVKLAREQHKPKAFRSELQVGFVSGCRSDQTSADATFGGRPNGALSYYLLKTLYEVPETTPLTTIRLEVLNKLRADHYEQEPQVEGPLMTAGFVHV